MSSPTSMPPSTWFSNRLIGDNPDMELTQEQIESLETALAKMAELDPADLPQPASELADLLGAILEEEEAEQMGEGA